ncbi:CHAT domain-containing protein [Streptosporangium sp. NPDC006007]|uniref:CHAT domain-containing protein n=1 Tax=Streptosporangium sp. NPDC006007 TaxID=3154575 RepID=UPI00339E8216
MLDSAAPLEAAELFAHTTDAGDVLETCHLVGLLHWKRAMALTDERNRRELLTAVPLLYVVHEFRSGLPLPEPLLHSFSEPTGTPDDRDAIWRLLLTALDSWVIDGGDPHNLRMAVAAGRNAVRDTPRPHPLRARRLTFLCGAQQFLFEHSGDMATLKEAVEAGRSAAAEAYADDPDRGMYLSTLANGLRVLFERTGEPEPLRESVDTARLAVRATAPGHDQRVVPLSALSLSLGLLYGLTDDAALLEEAIKVSAAAEAHAQGGSAPLSVLTNHSSMLRHRFERTGDQSVLNQAIAVARRAVDGAPSGTSRWGCLHNLGSLLQAQFEHTGDLSALDEAIDLERAVIGALPKGHTDAPLYQSTLVGELKSRFQLTGDIALLREAASWGRAAVEATPHDHPNRAMYLSNLALVLRVEGEYTDDPRVLGQSVEVNRLAVASARGRLRAGVLTNLGASLNRYFERTGDPAALEEAITSGRAAVAASDADDPVRSRCEFNLAQSLAERGLASGDDRPMEEAIELLESAASRDSARTAVRVEAAREWGRIAMRLGRAEHATRGFAVAVELLPRLAARGLLRADAARWMAVYSQLVGDAAACALNAGRADRAVELLEMGRGVLLAQALESRVDLADLREQDPTLATRFTYLCVCLDAEETGEPSDGEPDRRRELAEKLARLVAYIRTLPGLSRFLLLPDAAQLAAEAHEGPIIMINVSRYRCDALILTTGGVRVQELPALNITTVHTRLTAMRDALDRTYLLGLGERRKAERVMHETLAWLWDTVTGPVLERLGMTGSVEGDQSHGRVWWVPCGPLAYFPLHAAGHHLEEPSPGRRTVMDLVVSSYSPTVRALSHSRLRRAAWRGTRPPRALVIAMPRTPGASDLPGAEREFEKLTGLFPAVTGLIGEDATHDAVLSRLPAGTWAHFACHAVGDLTDPSNSHLLVHDHADRPLRVMDVSRLRLENSEFAYLSACGTAVTSPHLPDESIHVVTAFQLAGYPHVVGTLWEIDDTVAAEIAEHVYEYLASSGFDAGQAGAGVHRATRSIRDRHPRLPSLWAAHIYTGA